MYIKNFHFVVTLSLLCLTLDVSNGYFLKQAAYCFYEDQGLEEVEFDIVFHFNQELIRMWNSTVGNWTGYTARGIETANRINRSPWGKIQNIIWKNMEVCVSTNMAFKTLLGLLTAKPNMAVKSVKPSSGRHPSMLVCSAYNFYPKQILVTWLRDGEEITTDISSSQVLSDGDFYYQFHSFLEYTPTGETITCMVEHPSLTEPMFQHWDSSLPESDRNQIIVGSTGLLLGLVFVFTGLIYYKKKSAARITLHQEIPVEDLLPTGRMDEAPGPVEELLPPGEMDEAPEPEV